MSQAKENTRHTPGPWSVYTPKNNDGFGVDGPNDEYGDKQIVCYSVTTQANARLIAVAPELLEALQASPHMLHEPPTGKEPCGCGQCEFVRLRDAAIAKATA